MATIDQIVNEEFKREIAQALQDHKVQGCAIVITQVIPGKAKPTSKVLLMGRRSDTEPVTPNTRFSIASNTKLITAIAVIRALENLGLSIHTKVKTLIPEFELIDKVAERECTVEDLLLHRTGIPGYDDHIYSENHLEISVLDRFKYTQPSHPFREVYQYTSLNTDLCAIIVHRLTGKPINKYVQSELFDRLGMPDAGYFHFPADIDSLGEEEKGVDGGGERWGNGKGNGNGNGSVDTKGWWHGCLGDQLVEMEYGIDKTGGAMGAGRVWMSSRDLVPWLINVPKLPEFPICAEGTKIPGTPTTFEYPQRGMHAGLSLREYIESGVRIIGMTGGLPCMLSMMGWLPEYGVGFAVLSNTDYGGHYLRTLVKERLVEGLKGSERVDWSGILMKNRLLEEKPTEGMVTLKGISQEGMNNLIGEWFAPGFGTWSITSEDIILERPALATIPNLPRLYGKGFRNVFVPLPKDSGSSSQTQVQEVKGEEGEEDNIVKYAGCVEWIHPSGKKIMGNPFDAVLEGHTLKVYGLSDVRPEKRDLYPLIFKRVTIKA